jgi:hypothetical protein
VKKLSLVGTIVAVMLSFGCSSLSASPNDTAGERASQTQETQAKARQRAAEEKKAKQSALYEECRKIAGKLDTRLTELDSRLSVGLPFADYSRAVGSAKVAYDKLLRDAKAHGGVSEACINKVGIPLEKALNAYMKAHQVWDDCLATYSCSFDKGSPALEKAQVSWAKASRLISRADDALVDLQPAP